VNVVNHEKVKVHGELVVGIGKGMATNKNGFEVEFKLKNFKVQSNGIKMVVHVRKLACP
jgi:hypothetical protein